jgi:choline dehydrogenase
MQTMRAETLAADTIIIGGGSAGCALAARLSADPKRQVILLEAGPRNRSPLFQLTAAKILRRGATCDWGYLTEPDPNMANRPRYWPRGKVLGGSSAINGLIAIRGHRDDYDRWAAMGCPGWSWQEVLPYFLRLEDFGPIRSRHAAKLHNRGGPLPVSMPRGGHFLFDHFAAAAQETLGVGANDDFNGVAQDGVGYYAANVSRGVIPRRMSAAAAYLKEARKRPNLRVITDAHVHHITFDGRRATGVVYEQGGQRATATAARQVILSAGSIGSPQILQLSGIGDPEHLRSLGIAVVVPLSAVGENLQDHLQIPMRFRFHARSLAEKIQNVWSKFATAFSGNMMGTGPRYGATNFGMFWRSDPELTQPDLQFHIHPWSSSLLTSERFSGLSVSGWQLRPESRGRVRIRDTNPLAPPAISANYLSTEVDQRAAVTVLHTVRRLSASGALRPYIVEETSPGASVQSDADLLGYAQQISETTYHPVGTCRMGADAESVVDARLRVRGVEGLYVADASIMPTVISGNTNLPAVMIGEKAADIVAED